MIGRDTMTNLYQLGDHTLSSGRTSRYKIECDAATDDDVACWAWMIAQIVGPFGSVEGVPSGGLRLAEAMKKYRTVMMWFAPHVQSLPHLIVDDVLTTGNSMYQMCNAREDIRTGRGVIGAVVFARGPLPDWVRAVHQLPKELWDK